jgi:hypothetical protein
LNLAIFRRLNHLERQENIGVESTEDQPFASGLVHRLVDGLILECVHRRPIDRLDAGEVRQDRGKRWPVEPVLDADGREHEWHAFRHWLLTKQLYSFTSICADFMSRPLS